MNHYRRRLVVLTPAFAALSVALIVQPHADAQSPVTEWLTVGGDWANMRHSSLSYITPENVTKLGGAWTSQKFDQAASSRAMPVVKDGLMFVTVPPSVYALDAKTGATVWRFQGGGGRGQAPVQDGLGSKAMARGRPKLSCRVTLEARRSKNLERTSTTARSIRGRTGRLSWNDRRQVRQVGRVGRWGRVF
jgi:outer membrane protein assembly factor BamB